MRNKNNISKNIHIIGAGIAGLTAGALLVKQGYKVKIFEKEEIIGGRALSLDGDSLSLEKYKNILSKFCMNVPFSKPTLEEIFEKQMLQGYKLDLGYHAIGGGVFSNLNEILSQLGEHIDILESSVGLIKNNGYDFPFLSRTDKLKILPYILRLLFTSEKTMKQLDRVSMTETIKKYGKGKMKLILEIFSRTITTMNNLDYISTGEMFRSQRNLYKGSKPVGYPKNGLGSIHKKLLDYIIKNGGEIYLNTSVDKILIDKNRAIGIKTGNKEYFSDIVISNVPTYNLFSIVDEKYFPEEYVKNIKSLYGTGSLCAYYSLKKVDQSMVGKTFHFIERDVGVDGNDAVGMIDFMTASPKSGVAPQSDYLIQAYVICTPKEARDTKKLQKLKEILDKNLKKLIPDFYLQLNWVIYTAIWHLDGVAKTIDNVKPKIQTPISNLYLIGDCVKAPGIGINCAINSARALLSILSPK